MGIKHLLGAGCVLPPARSLCSKQTLLWWTGDPLPLSFPFMVFLGEEKQHWEEVLDSVGAEE